MLKAPPRSLMMVRWAELKSLLVPGRVARIAGTTEVTSVVPYEFTL